MYKYYITHDLVIKPINTELFREWAIDLIENHLYHNYCVGNFVRKVRREEIILISQQYDSEFRCFIEYKLEFNEE